MAEELRYVIIKFIKKEYSFIFIDKDRNVVHDSRIDSMDTRALI